MKTYNGWRNYETWNAALWVQNDEGWYRLACDFVKRYRGRTPWQDLLAEGDLPERTPDGVELDGPSVDYRELNEMLLDLI